jgi:SAM-dependent methyltransferase
MNKSKMRPKEWLYSKEQVKDADTKKAELEIIKKYRKGSILDVGCGSGYVLRMLGVDRTGIEFDDDAIKMCKGLHVIKRDLNKPFNLGRKFDTIVSLGVLEHLMYPGVAVQSIRKNLKNDGVFIASVPYHGLIKNLVIALTDFDSHYHYTDWHLRFFTPSTIREMLESNGFEIIEFRKIGRWRPMNKSMVAVCKKR